MLSFDAYLKFIEDDFLGGARLSPSTDGRPDPRPDVRENARILGNLESDFNFKQKPRAPFIRRQHRVAPVPGRVPGQLTVGVITELHTTYLRLQVTSTGRLATSLVGHVIRLPLSRAVPVYSDGRYATRAVLKVGDAVICVLVPVGSGNYRATELDDLGR